MEERIEQANKNVWMLWTARIWSIPIILYTLVLVIGYAVNWIQTGTADPNAVEGYPWVENMPPVLILLAVVGLMIAWRWKKIGGMINIIFIILAAAFNIISRPNILESKSYIPLILMLVVLIPGILFMLNNRKQK